MFFYKAYENTSNTTTTGNADVGPDERTHFVYGQFLSSVAWCYWCNIITDCLDRQATRVPERIPTLILVPFRMSQIKTRLARIIRPSPPPNFHPSGQSLYDVPSLLAIPHFSAPQLNLSILMDSDVARHLCDAERGGRGRALFQLMLYFKRRVTHGFSNLKLKARHAQNRVSFDNQGSL